MLISSVLKFALTEQNLSRKKRPPSLEKIAIAFNQNPDFIKVMAKNMITDKILIESKSARENQLAQIDEEQTTEVLNKIKSLCFALWKGANTTVTEQVAQFYEVPEANLRNLLKSHRSEFISDGLKAIKGKDLRDARNLWLLPSKTSQVTVWTPRAVLRAGMLMRDSIVAKEVRTSLLNAVEKVIPAQAIEIEKLKLELEVALAQQKAAEAQQKLLAASSALAIINPGLPALVLGRPEAVITKTEVIEKTVLVNSQGRSIASYEGLSKTKLATRYGLKKASDLVEWLKSIDKLDLLQPGLTATPCHYIPWSKVAELDNLRCSSPGF